MANIRKRIAILPFLLVFLFIQKGISQSGIKLKHAEIMVAEGKYESAIQKYLKLYKKDSTDFDTNLGLGILFEEYIYDEDAALPYLEAAYRLTKKDTQPELMFSLAKCRLHNGKYELAINLFKHSLNYVNDDADGKILRIQIEKYIENCKVGSDYNIKVKNKKFRIKHLGPEINTHYPDYAPVVDSAGNYMLFTTRRPDNVGRSKDVYDNKYFEDIYYSEKNQGKFLQAVDLDGPNPIMDVYANSADHDAVVSMTTDGKKLFFYKDNGLYVSEWSGVLWTKPERLPAMINVADSYEPHATMSPDGKMLVFSSNKTGGIGGLDLYMSKLQADGSWGEPENLSTNVNTPENEDGAYFSHDGKQLYFSSKGLSGYGGYDIYVSEFNGTEFSKPVNLEPPINSPNDDIYFSISRDQTTGYFASSRKGGYGDMDIYQFYEMDKPAWKSCMEKNNQKRPSNVFFKAPDTVYVNELALLDAGVSQFKNEYPYHFYWKINDSVMPTDSSRFFHYFRKNGTYDATLFVIVFSDSLVTRENYCYSRKIQVIERPRKDIVKIEPVFNKDESKISITGTVDTKKIDTTQLQYFKIALDTIYFDLNKSNLRKDAMTAMDVNIGRLKVNTKIVIKITAHTDSRASSDYNLKLSQKRAQAVITYLGKKGIGKKRILAVINMGKEGQLVNNCGDNKDCLERQYQLNRRVDFKVIGVEAVPVPKPKPEKKKPAAGKKTPAKKSGK
ncbi:MAG: PD40 domain-containing protein [Bacteroidia bacterium]|nr:PD40 domain-containing protein [Bacteroidia bacterium]